MSDRMTRQSASRAELLRQKRQQPSRVPVMPSKDPNANQPQTPVINPFGHSVVPPHQQPVKRASVVTTHSTPYSTPLRQSVSTPAKRKVYRVGANGVETRLPSLPALHFSWQWVSGFMTFALLVVVLLLVFLPVFKVNQIEVEGLQRVALADVQTVIQNNTGSIFTLDRQKIFKAVAISFPDLDDITLKIDMSGAVKMSVRERQPILAWVAGDYVRWIDDEGVVIPARGDGGALLTIQSQNSTPMTKPDVVIRSAIDYANLALSRTEDPLTPEDIINNINPDVLKAAIDLSAQMPLGAALVYDGISGMGWQDPRGWKVYFGLSLDDLEFKQVEYQTIVDHLSEMGVSPTTISVEHVDSPYYRTE